MAAQPPTSLSAYADAPGIGPSPMRPGTCQDHIELATTAAAEQVITNSGWDKPIKYGNTPTSMPPMLFEGASVAAAHVTADNDMLAARG